VWSISEIIKKTQCLCNEDTSLYDISKLNFNSLTDFNMWPKLVLKVKCQRKGSSIKKIHRQPPTVIVVWQTTLTTHAGIFFFLIINLVSFLYIPHWS
jgi:hypothetical protein